MNNNKKAIWAAIITALGIGAIAALNHFTTAINALFS